MKTHLLESEIWLDKRVDDVFLFFSQAENLNLVTPPWLHFEILTPLPIKMQPGALIEYRIRLHKIPFNWKTEITVWEPPHRFVDTQIKGPYSLWIHEHLFHPKDGGTLMIDRVEYKGLGGPLEPLINFFLVQKDVAKIFAYRKEKFREIFMEK